MAIHQVISAKCVTDNFPDHHYGFLVFNFGFQPSAPVQPSLPVNNDVFPLFTIMDFGFQPGVPDCDSSVHNCGLLLRRH